MIPGGESLRFVIISVSFCVYICFIRAECLFCNDNIFNIYRYWRTILLLIYVAHDTNPYALGCNLGGYDQAQHWLQDLITPS